jgi:hypothetical protein
MIDQEVEEFLAAREAAAQHINPETAEVDWEFGFVADPYGIDPDLPEDHRSVGRVFFARSPGSDIWVCFYDLPEAVRHALWERHKQQLSFPAGLPRIPKSR